MRVRLVVLTVLLVAGCDHPDIAQRDAGADATSPPPCSQMTMLADSFDDGQLSHFWPSTIGASEQNGVATISIPPSGAASGRLGSGRYFELRESQLAFEIGDSGLVDGQYELELDSQQTGFGLRIVRTTTDLIFETIESGAPIELARVPYDPILQRYWQISNHQDVTAWATSPDGITYTTQASATGLSYVERMAVTIEADRGETTSSFTVTIDDVNGGMPSGQACPIAQLHDDFDGTAIDPQWSRAVVEDGALVEADGHLAMTMGADNQNVVVALVASSFYDLREGTLTVEIPQMIDPTNTDDTLFVAIGTVDGSSADFLQSGGAIQFLENNGNLINSFNYNPTLMRWLRFRASGGVVSWQVSADGASYQTLAQSGDLVGLDRTDVYLEVEGHTLTTDSALVDNLNVAP